MFKTAAIMFKAHKGILPKNLQKLFKYHGENDYCTRQFSKMKVESARTVVKTKSISIIGVKVWNELDMMLRSQNNVHKFKRLFKSKIIGAYITE